MLRRIALAFGITLLVVGSVGFVPALVPEGKLFGLFEVNGMHNFVHLATGIGAILAGVSSERGSQLFFRIFGVIYALVAILGLIYGEAPVLGLIANNGADVALHVLIAAVSLYLGFALRLAPPVPG